MKIETSHIPSLNRQILRQFGLKQLGEHDSPKMQQIRYNLKHGIEDAKMQAIIAPPESGKTFLFRQLKQQVQDHPIEFVHVRAFADKWVRIGSILTAMIVDLDPKANIRRDIETRSRQVINVLGDTVVTNQRNVCLVIEDCQRLHLNTLRSLKLMREEDYAGRSPLFSIVMIGWPEFMTKLGVGQQNERTDITNRIDFIQLNQKSGWFDERERITYLENVFGDAITPEVRQRIARICFTPGELNSYVSRAMMKAYHAGYHKIDDKIVQPKLKEVWDRLKEQYGDDISLSVVANEAGVGISTVKLCIDDEPQTESTVKVRHAINVVSDRIADATSPNLSQGERNLESKLKTA